MEDNSEIIKVIKELLGPNAPSDTVINYWLNATERYILNYCNLDTLPTELEYVLTEMTCLRINYNVNGVGTGSKNVSSVTDGSQSVSYSFAGQKSFNSDDDILNGYKSQLNRFRRLKW